MPADAAAGVPPTLQAASSGWPSHLQPGYTEPPATVSTAYGRGDWAALLPEDGSLAHHAVLVALHEAAGELRALLTMRGAGLRAHAGEVSLGLYPIVTSQYSSTTL